MSLWRDQGFWTSYLLLLPSKPQAFSIRDIVVSLFFSQLKVSFDMLVCSSKICSFFTLSLRLWRSVLSRFIYVIIYCKRVEVVDDGWWWRPNGRGSRSNRLLYTHTQQTTHHQVSRWFFFFIFSPFFFFWNKYKKKMLRGCCGMQMGNVISPQSLIPCHLSYSFRI